MMCLGLDLKVQEEWELVDSGGHCSLCLEKLGP